MAPGAWSVSDRRGKGAGVGICDCSTESNLIVFNVIVLKAASPSTVPPQSFVEIFLRPLGNENGCVAAAPRLRNSAASCFAIAGSKNASAPSA